MRRTPSSPPGRPVGCGNIAATDCLYSRSFADKLPFPGSPAQDPRHQGQVRHRGAQGGLTRGSDPQRAAEQVHQGPGACADAHQDLGVDHRCLGALSQGETGDRARGLGSGLTQVTCLRRRGVPTESGSWAHDTDSDSEEAPVGNRGAGAGSMDLPMPGGGAPWSAKPCGPIAGPQSTQASSDGAVAGPAISAGRPAAAAATTQRAGRVPRGGSAAGSRPKPDAVLGDGSGTAATCPDGATGDSPCSRAAPALPARPHPRPECRCPPGAAGGPG